MAIPQTPCPKSQLRILMREALRGLTPGSETAIATLDHWLSSHPAIQTLAVYSALPGEVDLSTLVNRRSDIRWVYPKVEGEKLTFHHVRHGATELIPGSFGILEPVSTRPEVPVREIDAFLCPGLAFDPHGGRLGRGRGFYDRILAHARADALKIGVCFAIQQVPDTYSEAHDVHMDELIVG